MPSFPHPDSVTICEINRDLITAENLSDDQAKEAYGKALGITFTPIPFQCDYLVNTDDSNIAQNKTVLQAILSGSLETLFRPTDVRLLLEVVFHGISWHQHKHIIAFTSGPNQVTVCDYYDSGMSSVFRWCRFEVQSEQNFLCQFHFLKTFSLPVEIDIPTSSALFREGKDTCNFLWQFHFFKTFSLLVEIDIPTSPVLFPEGKDTCILNSESQRGVKALEWRPNGGRTLSVACKGGICIWSASYPGNAAPVRSGVIPGNISGSSGIRWTLVDFLRGHADEQVTALSWSPDGRYLASASCESSSFMIWDVAQATMECNKDEAITAIEIAERQLKDGDFEGAKKLLALKASNLLPGVDENISQLLTVCQVHCAAQNNLNDNSDRDWYGILQVEGLSDESSIRKQYRKLAMLLHPDKNKFTGAEEAFKLIGEASAVLLDSQKKVMYDNMYRASGRRCSDSEETFWTYCSSCSVKFKYYRRNLNKQTRCKVCSQIFVAKDLDGQSSEQAPEQPVATGFEDLAYATSHVEMGKACSGKGKRKAQREEEKVVSKERRKPDAKQNSEPAESTMGSRRRSLRPKLSVSYNEELYDDDIADLIESFNASTSGPGRKNIEEQDKTSYEAAEASDVPLDSGSAPNLETSSVAEVYKLPDPEFSDFDKERDEEAFAVNQIWACYDSVDGMPRFYARIRKVLSSGFRVKLTWLDPSPEVESAISWAHVLPVGCGRFQDGTTEETSDRLTFSHQVRFDKCTKTGTYHVYPRRGETWALFRNWDIGWSSDPEGHKPFSFDVVEILSDLHQVIGIDVCYLSKVEGFVSLFERVAKDGTVTHLIPPNELLRFSHRVPSNKLTGAEKEGVPVESFELDPAALLNITTDLVESNEVKKDTQTSTDNLRDEEADVSGRVLSSCVDDKRSDTFEIFYDFVNDKDIRNFRCGQIWAMYSRENGFPTSYGQIKKVEPSELHVGLLESCLSQDHRVCGMFQVSPEKSGIYTPSCFSHITDVEKITNNIVEIYPRKGQVWAIFKNWGAGTMLKGNERHYIVEVCKSNENCVDVWLLEHFPGTRSVFKHQKGERMHKIVIKIPRNELQRFCHQIPAFKLTGQKDGFLRGFWELDPAAVPRGVYRDEA